MRYLTDEFLGDPTAATHMDFTFRFTERYWNGAARALPANWEPHSRRGHFKRLMITLLAVEALWAVSMDYRGSLAQLTGHRTILDPPTDLHQHITRMSHSLFTQRQSGGIVSRLMRDIALAQNFVGQAMTNSWMDPGSCVFYRAVLFSMDAHLAAASLVVFAFYLACLRTLGRAPKRTSNEVQEALEDFAGDVQERIAGSTVIKRGAAEERETATFSAGARELPDRPMHSVRVRVLSTIMTADRIAALRRGRIVEPGRHGELLARIGVHARPYGLPCRGRRPCQRRSA